MKKLIFLLFVLGLVACKQGASQSTIDINIANKKTAKHINIPGTRLYMIPPANGTIAKSFAGIQFGNNSVIQVYDLVGGNYYTNGATFNKEGFAQQGVKVFDYKEIKVGGYPAKFVSIQGDLSTRGYGLLFGDTTFSVMVMGNFAANDEVTGKQIVEAMKSIYYDAGKKVDPFETAPFEREVKDSKFQFNQFAAGQYIYTVDGTDHKGEGGYSPAVVAMKMPLEQSLTLEGAAELLISKFQQHGMKNVQIKNNHQEIINRRIAYETELYGEMNGDKLLCYVCVIDAGEYAVAIECIAKKDMAENLQAFKQFARGLQVK